VTGTYGYRVQACNTIGCTGWSTTKIVVVSEPIAANGQSYVNNRAILTGLSGSANISFDIVTGNTWEVYSTLTPTGTLKLKKATGSVPASAVTVQYTWTFTGVPAGYGDGQGSVSNHASSPIAISGNPFSTYTTGTYSGVTTMRARTYQLKVDFFNALGTNISSSTMSLTAELVGAP
jgi:hypothetical protein